MKEHDNTDDCRQYDCADTGYLIGCESIAVNSDLDHICLKGIGENSAMIVVGRNDIIFLKFDYCPKCGKKLED